jgi:excisionase family DNA binding protein
MKQISETNRLAEAVAGVAATITEIIDARMQQLGMAIESKIAMRTIEPLLNRKQAAEHFQVTIRTIENWSRAGYLPYYKVGSEVRYRLSDIMALWDEKYSVRRRGTLLKSTRDAWRPDALPAREAKCRTQRSVSGTAP